MEFEWGWALRTASVLPATCQAGLVLPGQQDKVSEGHSLSRVGLGVQSDPVLLGKPLPPPPRRATCWVTIPPLGVLSLRDPQLCFECLLQLLGGSQVTRICAGSWQLISLNSLCAARCRKKGSSADQRGESGCRRGSAAQPPRPVPFCRRGSYFWHVINLLPSAPARGAGGAGTVT